jgi:hypothetical protein
MLQDALEPTAADVTPCLRIRMLASSHLIEICLRPRARLGVAYNGFDRTSAYVSGMIKNAQRVARLVVRAHVGHKVHRQLHVHTYAMRQVWLRLPFSLIISRSFLSA